MLAPFHNGADDAHDADDNDNTDDYNKVIGIALLKV